MKLTIEIDGTKTDDRVFVTIRQSLEGEKMRTILSYPFAKEQAKIIIQGELANIFGEQTRMNKTDVRLLYDKNYIGSWDLPEGRDAVLVIDHIEGGTIQNATKKERKPLVFFKNVKEPKKPMVLNATNRNTIIGIYGKYIEDWAGKPIAIFKTDVQAIGGGMTEGIRVRPTAPPMPKVRDQAQLAEVPREPGDEEAAS